MSRRKKQLGRKPNVPPQKSAGDTQISSYGSFVPFLNIGGRKVTPTKPDAQQLRNWSRFNPVIRRCVNLIKDRLVRHGVVKNLLIKLSTRYSYFLHNTLMFSGLLM